MRFVAVLFLIASSTSFVRSNYDVVLTSAATTEPYQASSGEHTSFAAANEDLRGTTADMPATITIRNYADQKEESPDDRTIGSEETPGYEETRKEVRGADEDEEDLTPNERAEFDRVERNRNSKKHHGYVDEDDEELEQEERNFYQDQEDAVYVVYVKTKDYAKNYSGVLINKNTVASTHVPKALKVMLCQEEKCKPTSVWKQTKDFTYWTAFIKEDRKPIRYYDREIADATVCTANSRKVYFYHSNGATNDSKYECAPSCNKGELIVCDDLPYGFVRAKLDDRTILVATIDDLLTEGGYPKLVRAMPVNTVQSPRKNKKKPAVDDDYNYDYYGGATVVSISMFSTLVLALMFLFSN